MGLALDVGRLAGMEIIYPLSTRTDLVARVLQAESKGGRV